MIRAASSVTSNNSEKGRRSTVDRDKGRSNRAPRIWGALCAVGDDVRAPSASSYAVGQHFATHSIEDETDSDSSSNFSTPSAKSPAKRATLTSAMPFSSAVQQSRGGSTLATARQVT